MTPMEGVVAPMLLKYVPLSNSSASTSSVDYVFDQDHSLAFNWAVTAACMAVFVACSVFTQTKLYGWHNRSVSLQAVPIRLTEILMIRR